MSDNIGQQATPHADLIAQVMDSRVPKNEREWAAAREIERLRARVAELERDAARYRWLRDCPTERLGVCTNLSTIDSGSTGVVGTYDEWVEGGALDSEVDAAMQEQPHE